MRGHDAIPLVTALLLGIAEPSGATLLTFDILPGQGDGSFLFDPTLGVLNSMWIEYEYSTGAIYSNFNPRRTVGFASVFVTWSARTTFRVGDGVYREYSFDWFAQAWGNNGPTHLDSFLVQGSTGRQSVSYSGAAIPEFFIAQGDENWSLVTLTDSYYNWPNVTPEATGDLYGNYWLLDMAGMNLETLRVNYLYNTPEPATWTLLLAGVLGLFGRRRSWIG